jgi:LuxR family maltose regulon positive regulatory protein
MQALVAPKPGKALAHLSEALSAAEPEGRVRTFLDLGRPMAELPQEAVAQGIAVGYASKLLAAFQGSESQVSSFMFQPDARQPIEPDTSNMTVAAKNLV